MAKEIDGYPESQIANVTKHVPPLKNQHSTSWYELLPAEEERQIPVRESANSRQSQ